MTEEVEVTCTEAEWRAMPESATVGRRCLRCIRLKVSPPGRARYTWRYGSLCNWCIEVDGQNLLKENKKLIALQPILDD